MGFFSSIGSVFGSSNGRSRTSRDAAKQHGFTESDGASAISEPKPTAPISSAATVAAAAGGAQTAVMNGSAHHDDDERAIGLVESLTLTEEAEADTDADDSGAWIAAAPPDRPHLVNGNGSTNGSANGRSLPRVAPIRSKQELFEELQKNYHEVVELVRKVDHHLDREQRRSARVMDVLDRVDGLIPTLERLPSELNDKAEQLNTELITAIRAHAGAGSTQIVAAVEKIGDQLRTGSKAQDELAHTMASFRQTIGDLAASTERSNEMIRSIEDTNATREKELATLISTGRRSQTIALGVGVTIAAVAMSVAVLAIIGW